MVPDEFGHFTGVPGGYWNPPGSQWALLGLSGREEEAAKVGAHPPKPNPNWEGGRAPFPSSLSPPSFLSYSKYEKEESYSRWE